MTSLLIHGILSGRATAFKAKDHGMKPPLLISTRPLTFSGCVIASRAAEKPPTELPMKTAGGRSRAMTRSSRASAKWGAVGWISEVPVEAPCQGKSMANVW